jgi:hypothetical protein
MLRCRPRTQGHVHSGGLNHLEGSLPLPSEGYNISKARTSSMMADLPLLRKFPLCIRSFYVRCSRTHPHTPCGPVHTRCVGQVWKCQATVTSRAGDIGIQFCKVQPAWHAQPIVSRSRNRSKRISTRGGTLLVVLYIHDVWVECGSVRQQSHVRVATSESNSTKCSLFGMPNPLYPAQETDQKASALAEVHSLWSCTYKMSGSRVEVSGNSHKSGWRHRNPIPQSATCLAGVTASEIVPVAGENLK